MILYCRVECSPKRSIYRSNYLYSFRLLRVLRSFFGHPPNRCSIYYSVTAIRLNSDGEQSAFFFFFATRRHINVAPWLVSFLTVQNRVLYKSLKVNFPIVRLVLTSNQRIRVIWIVYAEKKKRKNLIFIMFKTFIEISVATRITVFVRDHIFFSFHSRRHFPPLPIQLLYLNFFSTAGEKKKITRK